MASVNCAVYGCHNNWRKRTLTLSQHCFEHGKKRSECCGPTFTLHRPPTKEEDRRLWLKALNLKKPPKFPFVCSYHFVDGKPTPEHPYPEKWLGYAAPLKKPRRVLVRHKPASASCTVEGKNCEEKMPSLPPETPSLPPETPSLPPETPSLPPETPYLPRDHNYANPPSDQPLKRNQATQCSGPPELYKQLLRNDRLSLLYTGLSLEAFSLLADQLTKDYKNAFQLDAHDQVFMTLMKLRLNLLQDDLAERFHVSQSQVSKITSVWYDIMEEKMRCYIPWLQTETTQAAIPECFKDYDQTTTCVIDCFETPLQASHNLDSRDYYGQNAIKYLVAIAPCGQIMFVSAAYGGRCSDKFIKSNCGFLENLRPGDVVTTDRGFVISDHLREQKVRQILPAFTNTGMQYPKEDTASTRSNANVRVHVGRVIRRLKNFRIISQTVPIRLAHRFDKILRICAALSNLHRDIVHEEEED